MAHFKFPPSACSDCCCGEVGCLFCDGGEAPRELTVSLPDLGDFTIYFEGSTASTFLLGNCEGDAGCSWSFTGCEWTGGPYTVSGVDYSFAFYAGQLSVHSYIGGVLATRHFNYVELVVTLTYSPSQVCEVIYYGCGGAPGFTNAGDTCNCLPAIVDSTSITGAIGSDCSAGWKLFDAYASTESTQTINSGGITCITCSIPATSWTCATVRLGDTCTVGP